MNLNISTMVENAVDVPKRAMKKATRTVLIWLFPNPKKVLTKWTEELLSQGKIAHKIAFGLSWWMTKKFITRNGAVDLYERTLPDAAWKFRVDDEGFIIVIKPNLDSSKEEQTLRFETIEDFATLIRETTGTDPLVFLSEMIESWKNALETPEVHEEEDTHNAIDKDKTE